jgi:hypothetical protein
MSSRATEDGRAGQVPIQVCVDCTSNVRTLVILKRTPWGFEVETAIDEHYLRVLEVFVRVAYSYEC